MNYLKGFTYLRVSILVWAVCFLLIFLLQIWNMNPWESGKTEQALKSAVLALWFAILLHPFYPKPKHFSTGLVAVVALGISAVGWLLGLYTKVSPLESTTIAIAASAFSYLFGLGLFLYLRRVGWLKE